MSLSKARTSALSPATTLEVAELLTIKAAMCLKDTSSFASLSAFDHALAHRAPARAIVNLAALRHNARVLRAAAADNNAQVMAVVKADAYGHGAVPAAEAMAQSGVRAFAVATLGEAVELRKGLTKQEKPISILVLGAPSADDLPFMLHFDLEAMVTSVEVARHLAGALTNGTDCATRLRVHICIETGMCRVGIRPEEVDEVLEAFQTCARVDVAGITSQFAEADDPDSGFVQMQLTKFNKAVEKMVAHTGVAREEVQHRMLECHLVFDMSSIAQSNPHLDTRHFLLLTAHPPPSFPPKNLVVVRVIPLVWVHLHTCTLRHICAHLPS